MLPCDSGPAVSVPAVDSGRVLESEAGSGHTGLAEGWDWLRQHVDSVSDAWHKNMADAPGVDTGTSGPWFPPRLPNVSDRLAGPQT